MATKQRKGPLARFTVLDLTRARSGPTAVRQLADWGANVIKIEEPGDKVGAVDDRRHGPDFQNMHRNKRSMTLNLKSPELKDRLTPEGAEPVANSPEEFRVWLKHEITKWAAVVKAANIRID